MKFGSVTAKLNLVESFSTEKFVMVDTGDVILAEVLSENPVYPFLEETSGNLTELRVGDKIVGVIGGRQALRGFVGYAPKNIDKSGKLSLLNMGGVIGHCIDSATGLGDPIALRYLGTAIDEKGIINIKRPALPQTANIKNTRPVIFIVGTCMNVGKTTHAAKLIHAATEAGFKVGAAKVAGVASIKDLQTFQKVGAVDVKSFLDCGLPSTVDTDDLAPIVKTILNVLQGDLLIIELGDGIMGHYKVDTVFKDKNIMSHVISLIVCAADIPSVYGAKLYLEQLGVKIDIISGPATDNISGSDYIEKNFGIPAINGVKFPKKLFETTKAMLEKKL